MHPLISTSNASSFTMSFWFVYLSEFMFLEAGTIESNVTSISNWKEFETQWPLDGAPRKNLASLFSLHTWAGHVASAFKKAAREMKDCSLSSLLPKSVFVEERYRISGQGSRNGWYSWSNSAEWFGRRGSKYMVKALDQDFIDHQDVELTRNGKAIYQTAPWRLFLRLPESLPVGDEWKQRHTDPLDRDIDGALSKALSLI